MTAWHYAEISLRHDTIDNLGVLSSEAPLEEVFLAKGSLPVPSKSHSSQTVEQKHERAERLARQKRRSRCYKCGMRGHFGK